MKFDGEYESTNYTIAKHLAKHNQVFYVDNPYTWKDYARFKGTDDFNRRKDHFGFFADGIIETTTPNLRVVITPPLASIHFLPEGPIYRAALKLNEWLITKRIKQVIKKYKLKDYIFINSYNFHYPNVGDALDPSLLVYHCVDPLVSDYDLKHGSISEAHIAKVSDVIICSSKQLCVEKGPLNANTHFVPNAADISHSQKALAPDLPVADIIAKLPKPVLGYFGNIERRMDFDMLKEVIAANPDKSFVFVGPQGKIYIPDWFFDTPNVYLPGRMPYEDMPAIVKGFDVALLPFKKDEVSRTIFPLKLFEYLGAGKPVVSTDFNEDLKDFTADTVAYCSTAAEYSAAIAHALAEDPQAMIPKRLAVAADNTWDKRAEEFSEILNKYLELKTTK
ncbi:glycosyltransferase [Mucilaginibacter myungsuensis]|nr:glycosyltransferase [Mucilaginibacter myungsuensis]MDN3599500.1 glycosyltransferase [Mucilaginibacter myungsuensis]